MPTRAAAPRSLPASALLHVSAQSQLPDLPNGCEVTSLSMLLSAAGHPADKNVLADEVDHDASQPAFAPGAKPTFASIVRWGDPADQFVGNERGAHGYAVYHQPLARLLDRHLPKRALDLTGQPLARLLDQVAGGIPVVMWVTTTLAPTDDFVTWQGPHGPVRATPLEHAVLLVGYDREHLYVNDPLRGVAALPVSRTDLLKAWDQLGQQSLTLAPEDQTRAR